MLAAPTAARPWNKFALERRSRQRFPLALALEYRLLDRNECWGLGQTCNISSTGVLFEVAEQQPLFGSIELMVSWPYMLDGVCALKLVIRGRVVRIEGIGVAMESVQHEFRTAGVRAARGARA